jgi:hypothetical protein
MQRTSRNNKILFLLIALFAFAESCIPYICAHRNTPPGYTFSGQLTYSPDQNMYFSFISQARDGAFILKNKLTAMPHEPVFVNLEYWLVGFIQRVTGKTENSIYILWRFMGTVLLAIGFYMLVQMVLGTQRRRLAAFAAFFLTGGFGFVFALLSGLHLIGFDTTQAGIIDMRYGMLPFQQIITNPHFSFPHGLILIAYAFFLRGEQQGKTRDYILSGLFFTLIGLVRPYDIIPPVIIFPLYVLVTNGSLRFQFGQLLVRMLPLFMIVPVFLYNVWLFKYHPVFKYWSLQGHNAGALPAPLWHYMAYGIVGVLAIVRLLQARKYPPGNTGKFVFLWFAVTFVFIHLGKYIPALGWSPQIGVYLLAPLTLAACTVRLDVLFQNAVVRKIVIAGLAVAVVAGNVSILMYFSKDRTGDVKTAIFYTTDQEMEALSWMKSNIAPGAVVLADLPASQRIAKYTKASVIAAHYSVTPRFAENAVLTAKLLADSSVTSGWEPLPDTVHADYLYIRSAGRPFPPPGRYLEPVFSNSGIWIYKTRSRYLRY